MRRERESGFSLMEVLIASIILSFLVLAGLATMRSSVGFTTVAGRFTEGVGRSMEWSEGLRNEVGQDEELDKPSWDSSDKVPLTNVPANRTRVVEANPLKVDPLQYANQAQAGLKKATLHVDWTEPR